jgi:murein DD-endopeptidase MepM/ murein hydrolase activator NlpD
MKSRIIPLFFTFILLVTAVLPVKAQDQTQYPVYIVKSGDNYYTISDIFHITVDDLTAANPNVDPNFLSVGTQLAIPGYPGITGELTPYQVQLGETLDCLELRYKVSLDTIKRLNHTTSPNEIQPGKQLILPAVDDATQRIPVGQTSGSKTMLEIAALNGTTPWDLLLQNNFKAETSVMPADILYSKATESTRQVSLLDQDLSEISISPLPLVQGKTYTVTVNAPRAVTLNGSLNGMPLHFFPLDGNKQVALQGVNAMADPGLSTFTLSGIFADGRTFSVESPVLLISGDYPTADPLTVEASLIDPTVTGPEDELMRSETAAATPEKYWSGMFALPGVYDNYTAYFGERRTYNDGAYKSFHSGLDFGGGVGSKIFAAADGIVVYTGTLQVRGEVTIIDHGWGVYTAYFHQSEIDVAKGDKVTAGQQIGLVGNTGRVSDANAFAGSGAHLHWEVWVNGIQVDPMDWLTNEYP